MISKDYVELELHHQKKKKEEYQNLLKGLPEGRLIASDLRGKLYYAKRNSGQKTYLGTGENEEVQALQKRYFLEQALKRMNGNITLMDEFLKGYKSLSFDSIMKDAPKAYQHTNMKVIVDADFLCGENWEASSYYKKDEYREGLKHRTEKGELVRSKSEVIIANILYKKDSVSL